MNQPDTTREQLVAEERDAERAVLEAESAVLFAQATGTAEQQTAAAQRLEETRLGSMHMRDRMQQGLEAWGRYAAYQEAIAHAQANGVPIPNSSAGG